METGQDYRGQIGCSDCRFNVSDCPVANGEISIVPLGAKDKRGAAVMINGSAYMIIEGNGTQVDISDCVIFESRDTSKEAYPPRSSSQER